MPQSQDQPPLPTPRPPLPPPFSRPGRREGHHHVITPGSVAARPLRPTPYASAVIPGAAFATYDPGAHMAKGPVAVGAAAPASGGVKPLAELRDPSRPPTGVPANPELAVEGVDSVNDYPADGGWQTDAVFGWDSDLADWDQADSPPTVTAHSVGARAAATQSAATVAAGHVDAAADRALMAAGVLESLAGAVRSGALALPGGSSLHSPAAVLAAVLAAILSPGGGEGGGELQDAPREPGGDGR